ncbi:MAG: hypothetical protein QOC54_512 [Baekduia sp.]|nr:hypothetical protein [Baekduia sp.]
MFAAPRTAVSPQGPAIRMRAELVSGLDLRVIGAIWGRGAVDMKCQVAASAVALATLAREGFRPAGDLMLLLMADEEVGDAGVGSTYSPRRAPRGSRRPSA